MGLTNTPSDLLPGTLELLILKSLVAGPKHGYAIVEHLRVTSRDVLHVSETNRRARYYQLTPAGRKQLAGERAEFERMVRAIQHVLEAT